MTKSKWYIEFAKEKYGGYRDGVYLDIRPETSNPCLEVMMEHPNPYAKLDPRIQTFHEGGVVGFQQGEEIPEEILAMTWGGIRKQTIDLWSNGYFYPEETTEKQDDPVQQVETKRRKKRYPMV